VISSGRTEAAIKYKEVIYDLFNNGYSVYIHDHRGQGLSGRMLSDPEMGYVDDFQNYIDDMKYFYDNVVKKAEHRKIFLLAHSLGGAIGVTYLEQHPRDFTAAAFSSPMLGLPFPTCLVISILIGDEPEYAPQNGSYEENKEPFNENTLTMCKIRFDIMNKVFDENPKARLGGATYQWVDQSCEQFDYIFANLNKIETPLILFSAGDEEIVEPDAHAEFIEELN
ncbi:MAG: alpha/beta fold hydrolase, partial [Chlorobi bacterium]|nr:alpha/beta fold hydrolase [Chlorobiota bacterium]